MSRSSSGPPAGPESDPGRGRASARKGEARLEGPIAGGRKNWLFVAGEDGGAWAATLFTFFQSCRLQRVEPIAYLTAIMPDLIAGDVDPLRLTLAAYARCHPASRIA